MAQWVIQGLLAGSQHPIRFSDSDGGPYGIEPGIKYFKKLGIKAIVYTAAKSEKPEKFNFSEEDEMHFAIKDETAPTKKQLKEYIQFVDKKITEGKPVVVFCRAGKGRTGTFLAAYLMHYYSWDAKRAIHELRMRRLKSIASQEQIDCLFEFEKELKKQGLDLETLKGRAGKGKPLPGSPKLCETLKESELRQRQLKWQGLITNQTYPWTTTEMIIQKFSRKPKPLLPKPHHKLK